MRRLLLIPAILGIMAVPKITSGEFDLQGLNKQVQTQQSTIDNHEGRIENLEKDTSKLKETAIAPQTNHEAAPTSNTQVTTAPVVPSTYNSQGNRGA